MTLLFHSHDGDGAPGTSRAGTAVHVRGGIGHTRVDLDELWSIENRLDDLVVPEWVPPLGNVDPREADRLRRLLRRIQDTIGRIEQAKADWKAGRIPLPPNDNAEFIPLPDEPAPPAPSFW